MIVEDEPIVAFDNEHFLRDAGYQIIAAVDSYASAVAVLAEEQPDLILLDIRLAGERDGFDVARLAKGRGVPVLFVTGQCPEEARELSIGCLAKPYADRDLLAAIEAIDAQLRGRTPKKVPRGLSLY